MKNKRKPVLEFLDFSGGQKTRIPVVGLDTKTSPNCLNVYSNGPQLTKRKGFTAVNATAVAGNPTGNGLYNYVRGASTQYIYALFGQALKKMDVVGTAWDGSWDAVSANSTNGSSFSDSIMHFITYQDVLIMSTEAQDTPQRMTVTDTEYFDLDYNGTGNSPHPKYVQVWKNHLWLLNLAAGGELTEDCDATTGWTDSDTSTGAFTQITFQTNECFRLYAGATAGHDSECYQDIGTLPDDYQIEISTYFDTLSDVTAGDYVQYNFTNGNIDFSVRFADDGLTVYDGTTWEEVGVNIVTENAWDTWKFIVTGGTATAARVDILKDGVPVGLQIPVQNASAASDGQVLFTSNAGASGSRCDQYIDYCYITSISPKTNYIANGLMTTWTSGTDIAPTNWSVTPTKPFLQYKLNDNAASTTVTNTGTSTTAAVAYVNATTVDTDVIAVAGKITSAFDFTSASIHNVVPHADTRNAMSADSVGSICFWFAADSTGGSAHYLMGAGQTSIVNNQFHLSMSGTTSLVYVFQKTDTSDVNSGRIPMTITTGSWIHVALVQDAASLVAYVNGSVAPLAYTTVGAIGEGAWFGSLASIDYFKIGCGLNSADTNIRGFDGKIDDFRYYQSAITSGEVAEIYNSGDGNEGTATAIQEDTTFYLGTYSMEVTNDGDYAVARQALSSPASIAGVPCYYGGWFYVTNAATYQLKIDDGITTFTSATFSGNGAWQYKYLSVTPSATATSINAEIISTSAATIYIDGVAIVTQEIAASADDADVVQRTATDTYNNFSGTGSGTNTLVTPGDIGITGSFILNDKMYVTKKYSIHRFTYTGSTPLVEIKQIVSDVGTSSPRSVKNVSIPGQGEVVIYLGSDKHLYMFDGWDRQRLTDDMFPSNGLTDVYMKNINGNALDKVYAVVHDEHSWYEIFVPLGSATTPDYSIIYDYETKALWPSSNKNFTAAALCDDGAGVRKVYALEKSSGVMVTLDSSDDDNGSDIDGYWISGKLGDPTALMKMDELSLLMESVAASSIALSWRMDFETTWTTNTLTASSNEYNYSPNRNQNLVQIKIEDDSSAPAFSIWAIRFLERVLGISK